MVISYRLIEYRNKKYFYIFKIWQDILCVIKIILK